MRLPELNSGLLERLYLEGRLYRIVLKFAVSAVPLCLKFSCPRGFSLVKQDISVYQGAIDWEAWRSNQGTPTGVFNTVIKQWPVKGNADTPTFINPVEITSGGAFTPTAGQTAADTEVVYASQNAAGPNSEKHSIGSAGALIRGLPAGDYYLQFVRVPDVTVTTLGVFTLVYGADKQ